MNIQDQIKVMQHFADGGEVETRGVRADEWMDVEAPRWDWPNYDYCIKKVPKPKVKMWQALLSDGAGFFTSSHFFTDENKAKVRFEKRFIRLLPHTEIEVEQP